jgi:hypothetical protein
MQHIRLFPITLQWLVVIALGLRVLWATAAPHDNASPVARQTRNVVRFATFKASLNRSAQGQLLTDLSTPGNLQAQTVAEIIQRGNPDGLLINEFDFDSDGEAAQLFQANSLAVSQNGAAPVLYP